MCTKEVDKTLFTYDCFQFRQEIKQLFNNINGWVGSPDTKRPASDSEDLLKEPFQSFYCNDEPASLVLVAAKRGAQYGEHEKFTLHLTRTERDKVILADFGPLVRTAGCNKSKPTTFYLAQPDDPPEVRNPYFLWTVQLPLAIIMGTPKAYAAVTKSTVQFDTERDTTHYLELNIPDIFHTCSRCPPPSLGYWEGGRVPQCKCIGRCVLTMRRNENHETYTDWLISTPSTPCELQLIRLLQAEIGRSSVETSTPPERPGDWEARNPNCVDAYASPPSGNLVIVAHTPPINRDGFHLLFRRVARAMQDDRLPGATMQSMEFMVEFGPHPEDRKNRANRELMVLIIPKETTVRVDGLPPAINIWGNAFIAIDTASNTPLRRNGKVVTEPQQVWGGTARSAYGDGVGDHRESLRGTSVKVESDPHTHTPVCKAPVYGYGLQTRNERHPDGCYATELNVVEAITGHCPCCNHFVLPVGAHQEDRCRCVSPSQNFKKEYSFTTTAVAIAATRGNDPADLNNLRMLGNRLNEAYASTGTFYKFDPKGSGDPNRNVGASTPFNLGPPEHPSGSSALFGKPTGTGQGIRRLLCSCSFETARKAAQHFLRTHQNTKGATKDAQFKPTTLVYIQTEEEAERHAATEPHSLIAAIPGKRPAVFVPMSFYEAVTFNLNAFLDSANAIPPHDYKDGKGPAHFLHFGNKNQGDLVTPKCVNPTCIRCKIEAQLVQDMFTGYTTSPDIDVSTVRDVLIDAKTGAPLLSEFINMQWYGYNTGLGDKQSVRWRYAATTIAIRLAHITAIALLDHLVAFHDNTKLNFIRNILHGFPDTMSVVIHLPVPKGCEKFFPEEEGPNTYNVGHLRRALKYHLANKWNPVHPEVLVRKILREQTWTGFVDKPGPDENPRVTVSGIPITELNYRWTDRGFPEQMEALAAAVSATANGGGHTTIVKVTSGTKYVKVNDLKFPQRDHTLTERGSNLGAHLSDINWDLGGGGELKNRFGKFSTTTSTIFSNMKSFYAAATPEQTLFGPEVAAIVEAIKTLQSTLDKPEAEANLAAVLHAGSILAETHTVVAAAVALFVNTRGGSTDTSSRVVFAPADPVSAESQLRTARMHPFSFNPIPVQAGVKGVSGQPRTSPNNTKMVPLLDDNVTVIITGEPQGPLGVTQRHYDVPIASLRATVAPEVEAFNTLTAMLFREAAAVNADTDWLDLLMEDNAQHIITGFPRSSSVRTLVNSLTERWSTAIPMSAVAPGRWPLLEQLLFVMASYPVAKAASVALKKGALHSNPGLPAAAHQQPNPRLAHAGITRLPVCTGCRECRSAGIDRAHVGVHPVLCCDKCGDGFNRDGYCTTRCLNHLGSYHHPIVPCDSTWLVCLLYSITGTWGSSFKGNRVGATSFWTATHLMDGVAGHANNPGRLKSALDHKWRTAFGNALALIFRGIDVSELTPAALYPTKQMNTVTRSLFPVVGKNAAPAVAYLLMELSNNGNGTTFGNTSSSSDYKRTVCNVGGRARGTAIEIPSVIHGAFSLEVDGLVVPQNGTISTGVTLRFESVVSASLPLDANRRDPDVSPSETHKQCFEHKIVHITPPHVNQPVNKNSIPLGQLPGMIRLGLNPPNGVPTGSSSRFRAWMLSRLPGPPWTQDEPKLEAEHDGEGKCDGCVSACPVCLSPYHTSNTWWLLPCGHRVCSSCLAHVVTTNSAPPINPPEGWNSARAEFTLMVILEAFDRGDGAFLHPDWVMLSRSQAITCGLQPPEQKTSRLYPQGGRIRVKTTEVDATQPPPWAPVQQMATPPSPGDLPHHGHAPFAYTEAASTIHGIDSTVHHDFDDEPLPVMALPGTYGHKVTYPSKYRPLVGNWDDAPGWRDRWPKPLLNIKAMCPLCKAPVFGEYKVHFSKTPFYPPYQVVANKSCVGIQTWNCAFGNVPRPFKG